MSPLQLLSLAPLIAMLCIAAVIDWRERRIPNWLTVLMLISGINSSFLPAHLVSPGFAALGILIGFAIPFVLFAMGALGGGDVKLLAAAGSWLGPVGIVKLIVIESIVGMIIVVVQALK